MLMIKIWNRAWRRTPAGVCYIGRVSGGLPTIRFPFGNPFIVNVHGKRGECVVKHREWLLTGNNFGNATASSALRNIVLARISELKGKDLECWCTEKVFIIGLSPDARKQHVGYGTCHAETLAELANGNLGIQIAC